MQHPIVTTKPGKKWRSLKRPRVYEALRKRGMSKERAAMISNAATHKTYTLDQLEAFVSSPHYDAVTAGLIAQGVPALKASKRAGGTPGEQLAKGVTRIRGNLCNVHGKYGPCDKGMEAEGASAATPTATAAPKPAAKPKPTPAKARRGGGAKKPAAKPKQTPAAAAQANTDAVAQRMADSDTGLAPGGVKALTAFAKGEQPDASTGGQLAKMGLAEQANDGSFRMTSAGRAAVSAMRAGDYQKAVDAISQGTDAAGKRAEQATARQERTANAAKRQQDAAGKRATAQAGRELAKRQAAEQARKKPAKASTGGSKQPEKPVEKPAKPAKRVARGSSGGGGAPSGGGSVGNTSAPKPKPDAPKPEQAPAKQVAPALQDAAQKLSDGAELSDADTQALIRNGLAKIDNDGTLVLTSAGMRATQKSFRVFKDANGRPRWVAQSSTAFQDRDKEIVSTKALADDCAFADTTGEYGPLRWWHTPGLDLGDCDFNAMHGRVLIESGTFRSPAIAQKVARAANGLEISLGFIHLPNEPDADGVFHHIRRFERSLVPRGKASNRFTAFTVKEITTMEGFTPEKIKGFKDMGFTDEDIASFARTASTTEKAATDQGVAFKADEPAELPDLVINGITYKAFPPPKKDEEAVAEVVETDAMDEMMVEEEPEAEGGLSLSPEDLSAIGQLINDALQGVAAQIMGALDLEKKVSGHVQGLLAPFQQAQATKDAALAETNEQLTALTTKVAELTGDQPAASYRASAARDNVLTDATMLAAVKSITDDANDPWADIKAGLGLSRPQ